MIGDLVLRTRHIKLNTLLARLLIFLLTYRVCEVGYRCQSPGMLVGLEFRISPCPRTICRVVPCLREGYLAFLALGDGSRGFV